jgi:hypothetical protein
MLALMVIDESLSRHRIGRWIPERTPAGRPDLGAMPIIAANPWTVLAGGNNCQNKQRCHHAGRLSA